MLQYDGNCDIERWIGDRFNQERPIGHAFTKELRICSKFGSPQLNINSSKLPYPRSRIDTCLGQVSTPEKRPLHIVILWERTHPIIDNGVGIPI